MAVVYFSVGRQKKNSQGRVEIKGAPSNFSVLQLAGETAQHDLDLRHPKFASKRKIRSCWQLQLLKVHKYTTHRCTWSWLL